MMSVKEEKEFTLCRIEGWLKVCECAVEHTTHSANSWAFPYIAWHPGYCVIRQDEQSLICYKDEQAANRVGRQLYRIRLDGGYSAFYRKWGYPAPAKLFLNEEENLYDKDTLSEDDETVDDPYLSVETICVISEHETLKISNNTAYDLIEPQPNVSPESQSLDRRGWPNKRLMPSATSINFMPDNNLAMVESPSTSHKLANFLTRPFRTNPLKRAKSVSKLDRSNKRSPLDSEGPSWSSWVGLNNRNNIRNSRSHESLLSYSTTTHAIDLACNGCTVTPLHTSILGAPHCFQISTNTGATKYYACRTAAERDRWLESLRTMQTNHDQVRRQENSLQLWIFASKGIPCKRKYYCELCLDHTLYCRTTSKLKMKDECFWGEQFEINHLPKLDTLCINLYREADRKKKKDRNTLIGYIQIPVSLLAVRHPVEKWYAVTGAEKLSSKGETPSIRVKARYQTVTILPLRAYDSLLQYVQRDYLTLCSSVENLTSVKSKEDIATCMVHILHKQRLAKDFLCDLVMSEVEALDNYHLMFRGNSLATKAMEAYMKLIGDQYLHDTLAEFIQNVLECDEDCEVDPSKLANLNVLNKNQETLMRQVHMAWGKIVNSFYDFPIELKHVFYELRKRLDQCGRIDLADYLISSNIFLRFLCPSILSPSLFNLIQEYPNDRTVRNLTLIAKTIQTLANFTKFGVKEHYMEFMNKFVDGELDHMRQYLNRISSAPTKDYLNRCSEWDGCVDLGKELSLLHSYLVESWPNIEKNLKSSASDLKHDLEFITDIVENPSNLMNLNPYNKCESLSPTSPISDYENNNNESNHSPSSFEGSSKKFSLRKISATGNNNISHQNGSTPTYSSHQNGTTTVMNNNYGAGIGDRSSPPPINGHRKKPASHLNSNDDYVWYAAIDENLGLRRTGMIVQQNRQRHTPVNGSIYNGYPVVGSPGELSAAGAVAGADTDGLNYVDDYNIGSDDRDTSHDSDHMPLRGSRGSLTNGGGVASSGYQSLNYSTSNSSSPVETNQIQKKNKYQISSNGSASMKLSLKPATVDQCNGSPPALAISNPLYCMQTVPLIKQKAPCYSLPDIQQELLSTSSTVVAVNGSADSSFDDQTPSNCVASSTNTKNNHQWHRGSSVAVANQKQFGPRSIRPSLENAFNNNSLSVDECVNGSKGLMPRTNPRYMSSNGRSPTLPGSSSPNVRPAMRRTKTDCGIVVSGINVVDNVRELELRAKFLHELDDTRKRLEENQAKLKMNESRDLSYHSRTSIADIKPVWTEQVKPIISRLKLVEFELQEELSSSMKKQQIIDAQQKRINILQTANENLLATLNNLKHNNGHKSTINGRSSTMDDDENSSMSSSKYSSTISSCVPLTVKQSSKETTPTTTNGDDADLRMNRKNLSKISPTSSETASEPSTSISQSSDVYDSETNLFSSEFSSPEHRNKFDDTLNANNNEITLDFAGLKTTEC